MKKNQVGFTLIESAIVLAIASLLILGILKGQTLINNFKIKSLTADFRSGPLYAIGYTSINTFGGKITVTNTAQSPIIGLPGITIVCSDVIPGDLAKELDMMLDDGHTETGHMMVVPLGTSTATMPLATSTIDNYSTYLVCMSGS